MFFPLTAVVERHGGCHNVCRFQILVHGCRSWMRCTRNDVLPRWKLLHYCDLGWNQPPVGYIALPPLSPQLHSRALQKSVTIIRCLVQPSSAVLLKLFAVCIIRAEVKEFTDILEECSIFIRFVFDSFRPCVVSENTERTRISINCSTKLH
jgi:hypothetical protein